MHLKQAGKLKALAGVCLGDFPGCDGAAGSESVKEYRAAHFHAARDSGRVGGSYWTYCEAHVDAATGSSRATERVSENREGENATGNSGARLRGVARIESQ